MAAVVTAPAPEVVEHGEVVIGHPQVYRGHRFPTVQRVTVDGEPFLRTRSGVFYAPCGKCDAEGRPGGISHFGHVFDGVCFQCGGTGHGAKVGDLAAAAKRVRRRRQAQARAERKRQAEADAQAAEVGAWRDGHQALCARLDPIAAREGAEQEYAARDEWGAFLFDMASQAQHRPLTPKQAEAAWVALIRHDEQQAAEQAKRAGQRFHGEPGDKVTGAGTVTVAMGVETRYGYARLVVVEGDGEHAGVTFKAFGSGKSLYDVDRGDEVSLTGEVKAHEEYEGVPQTVLKGAKFTVTEREEST